MNSPSFDLSIIIPAYNEELRLPKSIERIAAYLSAQPLRAEIIVVDDGSTDASAALIERYRETVPNLRLVSNDRNHGKGFSVRHGVLEACGEIALFTDADLSTPIEEADKLIGAITRSECDIAIGSRGLDRSLIEVHQSAIREQGGILFNQFVRAITGLPLNDTQCGFKAFRRVPALVIFEQQRIEGFGFDPEILFLAKKHGLRVLEIPVRWAHDPGTKVNVLRDGIRMVLDLLVIRWDNLLGRYPRNTSS